MNRKLKDALNNIQENTPPVSEARLHEVVELTQAAYDTRRKRREVSQIGFVLRQAKFIALPIWIFQFILLLCIMVGLHAIISESFIAFSRIPKLLGLVGLLVAATSLPVLIKSHQYKMIEIESATYMSMVGLTLSRLIIVGIGDAVMLLTLWIFGCGAAEVAVLDTLSYILLPFLLATSGCLWLFNHIKLVFRKGIYSVFYYLALLSVMSALFIWQPELADQLISNLGILLCVLLAGFLFVECKRLLKELSHMDYWLMTEYS
ncbi:MAG: hypothetical protein LUK37_20170 [Clostridia bacterium]|nr:hypothetical protein [Clostridia bacterium]